MKIETKQLQKKHEGNSLKVTSISFCGHSLNHSHLKELSNVFHKKLVSYIGCSLTVQ